MSNKKEYDAHKYLTEMYNDYVDKCKRRKVSSIDYKEFLKVHFVAQRNLLAIKNSSIEMKKPYIAITLDENFIYYAELHDDKAIVNIWDYDEFNYILGDKKHEWKNK